MTRVLSALALLSIVVGTILILPPLATVVLAEVVALLAFIEYARLARAASIEFPMAPTAVATLATVAVIALAPNAFTVVVMAAGLVIALTVLERRVEEGVMASVGAASFAVFYVGVPIGAVAAIQMQEGQEALLLLLATIVASDTAQYYGGRLFGHHLLAPSVSPKKTMEGAICGVVAASFVFTGIGKWVFPEMGLVGRVILGVTLATVGIAGDLFESHLKRSSGVKDSSQVIPGHGGVLDRIDALLFAGPVYYTVVVFAKGPLP